MGANTQYLTHFQRALSQQGSRSARVMILGDSITEGYNATTLANSWPYKFADRLRSWLGQPTNNASFIAAGLNGASGGLNPWTPSGSVTYLPDWGPNMRNVSLAAAAYVETTQYCDRIRVVYPKVIGAGSFKIKLDGVDQITIAQAPSGSAASQGGFEWDSGALTLGNHTLRIEGVSGTTYASGAYFHRSDYSTGIEVWAAGHANATTQFYTHAATSANGPTWVDDLRAIRPDLLIIELGANDVGFAYPAATIQLHLEAIIDQARVGANNPNLSVVLVPCMRNDFNGGDFTDIVTAMASTQASRGAAIIDVYNEFYPDGCQTGGTYYGGDGVHPNDAGHLAWADYVADQLIADVSVGTPTFLADDIVRGGGTPTLRAYHDSLGVTGGDSWWQFYATATGLSGHLNDMMRTYWANRRTAAGDDLTNTVGQYTIFVPGWMGWDASSVGTMTRFQNGFTLLSGYVQNGGSLNDELKYVVFPEAGSWSLDWWHVKTTGGGIVQVYINGVAWGTPVDTYNGSTTYNNKTSITNIGFSSTGPQTISFKVVDRHASSTNWRCALAGFALTREKSL